VRKADNLTPSCAVVTKSGKLNFLETSGPLRARNGTALPYLLLLSHLLPCLPIVLFSLWFSDQVLCVFHLIAERSEYVILLEFIILIFGVD